MKLKPSASAFVSAIALGIVYAAVRNSAKRVESSVMRWGEVGNEESDRRGQVRDTERARKSKERIIQNKQRERASWVRRRRRLVGRW